jgi:hypothetical protein
MSTLELTWASNVNHLHQDSTTALGLSRYQVWFWMAALCDLITDGYATDPWHPYATGTHPGKWTVFSSCNGAGGAGSFDNGGGPAVNKWGNTYTAANLIWAAAASNHSWIVLKSPNMQDGYPFYVILDLSHATPANYTLVYCKTAPLTSAGGTDGTATARPISVDEVAYTVAQNNGGVLNNGIAGTTRCHMSLSTNGEWNYLVNRQGSNTISWGALFRQMYSTKAYDDFKAICFSDMAHANSYSGAAFSININGTNTTNVHYGAFAFASSTAQVIGGVLGGFLTRPKASVAPQRYYPTTGGSLCVFGGNYTIASASVYLGVDPVNGEYQTTSFFFTPVPATTSISTYGLGSAHAYLKTGSVKDLFTVATLTSPGVVEPAPGPPTTVIVGWLWLPLSGVPIM